MATGKKAAAPKKAAQPKATAPAKHITLPRVGDTCQYTPAENDQELSGPGPFAAMVTEAKTDGTVNLQVLPNGPYGPFFRSNVPAGSGPYTWA